MATLVVIAAPSFAEFLERQRIAADAETISGALSTARSEALTRLDTVDVCWNTSNTAVTVRGVSINPEVMAVLSGPSPAELIKSVDFVSDGLFIDDSDADNCVSFDANGRLITTTATGGALAFGVCKESGETTSSKGVMLSATGRASTGKNDGGGIINCI